jgi:hypothetical protein
MDEPAGDVITAQLGVVDEHSLVHLLGIDGDLHRRDTVHELPRGIHEAHLPIDRPDDGGALHFADDLIDRGCAR